MLLRKNRISVLDPICYFPIIPNNINTIALKDGQDINHLKVNYNSVYLKDKDLLPITAHKEDGTIKSKEEIYQMMGSWDPGTLIDAFFQKDLEAGSISGSGGVINKIAIKRLSADSNYTQYETVGEIPYTSDLDILKENVMYFRDYLINSGEVYLYSIQPIIGDLSEVYGQIQNKIPALNTFEYTWVIDRDGNHIRLLDAKISNTTINSKDATIETFGSPYPYVNRYSSLNYKTFVISGTIASIFDISNDVSAQVDDEYFGTEINVKEMIKNKMSEVYGENPLSMSNSMTTGIGYERKYRDKLTAILNDGKEKILKTDTEGLMLVKFTNVSISPKQELGRVLYDFSLTATEIGKVTPEIIKDFNLLNKKGVERNNVL